MNIHIRVFGHWKFSAQNSVEMPKNIQNFLNFWVCFFDILNWGLQFSIRMVYKKYFRLWPIYYSSRIVFSHIPIEFGQTGNSAIRSADPENPTVEPNIKWIGRPLAEIWPFEIFKMWGRWSVLNIYFFLHWSHNAPLRYVRNVAREE